jgi:iron complex outermembrane recepter protein
MKHYPCRLSSCAPHQAGLFRAQQNDSFRTQCVALVATILCLSSSAVPALAQSVPAAINPAVSTPPPAGSGKISGRVQNLAIGKYLENARVTIKETNQTVTTDKFGEFLLLEVPAGSVTLEVFYTGLDLVKIPLTMTPGGAITQDINLTSVVRYGKEGDTVKLDPYIAKADREINSQAIAVNERRFAPNIKSVVSTDTLGGVLGSSIGEFLKTVAGITAEYDTMDVSGINLRGLGAEKTAITADGFPLSNIFVVGPSRAVDMRSMSLNDITRVEVTKVPTPAMGADSLAGSVNFVRKNAFERKGMSFNYGLSLASTSENFKFGKSPSGYRDRNTSNLLPGGNFDFTWPVSKNFGLVISGLKAQTMGEQHAAVKTWSTSGTGTNGVSASQTNPVMSAFLLGDGPRYMTRTSYSIKADWKVGPHSVLSFNNSRNSAITEISSILLSFGTGTNGTPSLATGTALTWDQNNTRGATGRGSINNINQGQELAQTTDTSSVAYTYDDGRWKIDGGIGLSSSESDRLYEDIGSWFQVNAVNRRPIRVNFLDIGKDQPGKIEVFDNNGLPFDWRELDNYTFGTANSATTHNEADIFTAFLNARHKFQKFAYPTSLQVGAAYRLQTIDNRQESYAFNFNGPDGLTPTATVKPYANQVYVGMDSKYGFKDINWVSPYRAYQAYLDNPLLFGQTAAQRAARESFRIDNSEYFEESVKAVYLQGDVKRLFAGRLHLLTGVRFEQTTDVGIGARTDATAVYQRNANGSFLLDAAGNPVRKPEAGSVGSLEEVLLTKQARRQRSEHSYEGYYPSFHLTFDVREDILLRAAYARTYGRPDYADVIPRTVITIPLANLDDLEPLGTLTVRNPALEPWTADNFDLSAEYYTQQGGLLSAGVFVKEIKNFFGNASQIATPGLLTELGLSQDYVGWTLNTKFNSGDARVSGFEVDVRQSLQEFGAWGRHFTVFGNVTKLELEGSAGAQFTSFIPESGNWGLTFANKRLTATMRWNYRGLQRLNPVAAFGPEGYRYLKIGTTLDVSAAYQLSPRLSLNVNAVNVGDTPQIQMMYNPSTPGYAKQQRHFHFGAQLSVGITGSF